MDKHSSTDKQSRDISTQTDIDSNKGLSAIQDHKHSELFTAIDELSNPE